LDQSFQLAQRWLLHDFMPSRIHANQKMVGAARSPIRRLNEPEARADPSLRRESAVADRRYQFVAASSLLVWICESVGLRLFLFAARRITLLSTHCHSCIAI
jgi:hypothetical protein